jgi:hypothetical protein
MLFSPAARHLGILLTIATSCSCSGEKPSDSAGESRPVQAPRKAVPFELLTKHLDWAQSERDARVEPCLLRLRSFFSRSKEGVPTFSRNAFGWGSELRLIKDCIPFTSHESNKRYLEAQFKEHIFAADDLQSAVRGVIDDYVRQANDVDNQMLVRMRLDLANLPEQRIPEITSQDLFQKRFESALHDVQARIGEQIATGAADFAVSELATRIAVQVLEAAAVELGTEGGVLAAGASSSWATLGVGLVVGIIVDRILDWWLDPVGELQKKLTKELDRLHELIVDGDGNETGLRAKLHEISRGRRKMQTLATAQMIEELNR